MKKLSTSVLSVFLSALTLLTLASCSNGAAPASSAPVSSEQASAVSSEAPESSNTPVTIKVGVVGENNEQWEPIKKSLAAEGITIELVKFSDYTQPNQALSDGEIDLNAFQHITYLNNAIKEAKYDLTSIGDTVLAPLGIYSKKIKDLKEVTKDAKVAIPNDATNGGRALKLLESAGLIKVDPAAGYLPTLKDITENPLNLEIIEIEAAQTPRLLEDVTISVINGGHAIDAGLVPSTDAIYLESVENGSDNPYVNIIAARTADKENPNYLKVVEAYHTDEVKKVIEETYKGSLIPVW